MIRTNLSSIWSYLTVSAKSRVIYLHFSSIPIKYGPNPASCCFIFVLISFKMTDTVKQSINGISIDGVLRRRRRIHWAMVAPWTIYTFFKKWANSGLFFVFSFFSNTILQKKNCRLQRDLNSDCRSRRRARWPLDHHHGPIHLYFALGVGKRSNVLIPTL